MAELSRTRECARNILMATVFGGRREHPTMPFRIIFHYLRIAATASALLLSAAAMSHASPAEMSRDCMIERGGMHEAQAKDKTQPCCCFTAHCCALVPDLVAGEDHVREADNPVARSIQPNPLILVRALDPPPRSSFG